MFFLILFISKDQPVTNSVVTHMGEGWINEWMKGMLVFELVSETSSACISAVRFKLVADSACISAVRFELVADSACISAVRFKLVADSACISAIRFELVADSAFRSADSC